MEYHIIQSGSKGNATLIYDENTTILIDMGLSLSALEDGLNEIHKTINDIDAFLVTHDHSDHVGGKKFVSSIPTYALYGVINCPNLNVIHLFEEFKIKTLDIIPLKTNHDATDSCGFLIKDKNSSLVYITDTGFYSEENTQYCKNADYYIFESNHDIRMLLNTNRTFALKERIMSNHGHLCNEDSAIAICSLIGNKTKDIILAHISEEANTPEVALKAYRKIFDYYSIDMDKYNVKVASQRHSLHGGHNGN